MRYPVYTINTNGPEIGINRRNPEERHCGVVVVTAISDAFTSDWYGVAADFNDAAVGHKMNEPNSDDRATGIPWLNSNSIYWVAVGVQWSAAD